MTRKNRQPDSFKALHTSAPDPADVIFRREAFVDGTARIKQGQSVSYELALGEDGLWYAVNIIIEDDEPKPD